MFKQAVKSPITCVQYETCTLSEQASKERIRLITTLLIENIFYSRKIFDENRFENYSHDNCNVQLKRFSKFDNHHVIKGIRQVMKRVNESIDKGYLKELLFEIKQLNEPDNVLEKYIFTYQYSEYARTTYLEQLNSNMQDCFLFVNSYLNKMLEKLPPVKDLDFDFSLTYYSSAPSDYNINSPYLVERGVKKCIANPNHSRMDIGHFKTPFCKLRACVEGYTVEDGYESTTNDDISSNSYVMSQTNSNDVIFDESNNDVVEEVN